MQLQVLVLVAAEVFGRVLPVSQNALMLMAVLGGIAFTNMMCAPVRDHLLVLLEYGYLTVLSLTITLGLYFTGSDSIDGTAMVSIAPHRQSGWSCGIRLEHAHHLSVQCTHARVGYLTGSGPLALGRPVEGGIDRRGRTRAIDNHACYSRVRHSHPKRMLQCELFR